MLELSHFPAHPPHFSAMFLTFSPGSSPFEASLLEPFYFYFWDIPRLWPTACFNCIFVGLENCMSFVTTAIRICLSHINELALTEAMSFATKMQFKLLIMRITLSPMSHKEHGMEILNGNLKWKTNFPLAIFRGYLRS